jgi:hypothetical protein
MHFALINSKYDVFYVYAKKEVFFWFRVKAMLDTVLRDNSVNNLVDKSDYSNISY